MRKLLRSIARAKMKKAGIQHINRKVKIKHPITGEECTSSYFSMNWREYLK